MKNEYLYYGMYKNVRFLFILIFFLNISNVLMAQSQKCKATLKVFDNETSKKAGESGVSYALTLTNTGNQSTNFSISVDDDLNAQLPERFGKKRVKLNHQFLNAGLEKMKNRKNYSDKSNSKLGDNDNEEGTFFTLNLASGESYNFFVKIDLTANTQIGSFNSTTVTVSSNDCSGFSISQTLNTEIIDGE